MHRRRRKPRVSVSSQPDDSFHIRWHSISNIGTPSIDIMSSPDPLNDPAVATTPTSQQPPSSRRNTRSQRSNRFAPPPRSTASRSASPKKKMFELELGEESSPQRLLVTVEAGAAQEEQQADTTRRRLFPASSSPAKGMRATTTTVPLRGSAEDESSDALIQGRPPTPRRKRQSNGTPRPGATKRGRPPTPMKGTPRRRKSAKLDEPDPAPPSEQDLRSTPRRRKSAKITDPDPAPPSEQDLRSTPRSAQKTRTRQVSTVEPSSDANAATTTQKRQRRRRQALAPEELVSLSEDISENPAPLSPDDDIDLVRASPELAEEEAAVDPTSPSEVHLEPESDIWMTTLSDAPTPRAKLSRRMEESIPILSQDEVVDPQDLYDEGVDLVDADMGFTDLQEHRDSSPAASQDAESEAPGEVIPGTNDTIAQGEDFSMIFADSLPSLQANLSQSEHTRAHNDFGEETSFIINKTLESLKRSRSQNKSPLKAPTPSRAAGRRESLAEAALVEKDGNEATPTRKSVAISPVRSLSSHKLGLKAFSVSPLRRRAMKNTARSSEAFGAMDDSRHAAQSSPSRAEDSPTYEDSFSEVPDAILEAATPGHTAKQFVRGGSRRQSHVIPSEPEDPVGAEDEEHLVTEHPMEDDGMFLIDADVAEAELLGQAEEQLQTIQHRRSQETQGHIDDIGGQNVPWLRPGVTERPLDLEPEQQAPPSVASSHFRSETSRLPTPDDTPPSNNVHDDQDDADKAAGLPQPVESVGPSPARSVSHGLGLSRPRIPEIIEPPRSRGPSVELGMGRAEKTPLQQMSSPPQEPTPLAPENILDRSRRPTLSPIVRAGRALQNITSDPPTPEPREQQLRSPFQSSGSKDRGARESANRESRGTNHSPRRGASHRPISSLSPRADPFASAQRSSVRNSFMQALTRHSTASPSLHLRPLSRESIANSLRVTPPAEEMSWVADAGPISPRLRGDGFHRGSALEVPRRSEELAAEVRSSPSVGASREKDTVEEPQEMREELEQGTMEEPREMEQEPAEEPEDVEQEVEQDEEQDDEPSQPNDDETDIWELEARRETPRSVRQQPFGNSIAPNRRRSNLPSPWRGQQNETSRTGGLAGQQSAPQEALKEREDTRHEASALNIADESEEFSRLLQTEAKEKKEAQQPPPQEKGKGFDLSSFFSSPAAIPGMLASKTRSLWSSKDSAPTGPTSAAQAKSATLPTNSMFPQLPDQSFRPRQSPRKNTLLSQQKQQPSLVQSSQVLSSAPPTPSRAEEEPLVAREPNLVTEPQQENQQSVAMAKVGITPPRMQMKHADIRRWQQNTNAANQETSPAQLRPLLRPLPSKQASPSKSSLRSPLKPKTPGRVVEFTSSVLSPADQARQRIERRMSNADGRGPLPVALTPQPDLTHQQPTGFYSQQVGPIPGVSAAPQPAVIHPDHVDTSDVVMTDASPADLPAEPSPLSQTVWTRQHWLLLDSMLQQRREGPFDNAYPPASASYLGKAVKCQGAAMRLEQWHLDCVDAFKAVVGGWDEGALAKRVFALLLGEERRVRQARRKRVGRKMFH